ncbi:ABC transporter permease [Arthrobacter mangrovi]|uniref:ABC transporter n=1 Tax=Arthrobacter mangrovi TaxID=2966350 RepID=A0ABQ5MPU3_9MICC|nr:ABC transporter permease [Arthrobacter mangrovi]GLB66014.1 ABC transporter [Arthrobacter mangrovi]
MNAPAPLLRRVLLQGRYETVAMLRNGEQLLIAVILPLMALVGLSITPLLDEFTDSRIDMAAPGVLALCAVSTGLTGQGIATGFDRRYGVLRFLSTTPLGQSGLILGKVIAVLTVLAIQTVVISTVALLLGWHPAPAGIAPALVQLVLGAGAFTSLGLLIAGTVRPEATLAITNLLWVLLAAAGGILFPIASWPDVYEPAAHLLPSTALGDALRSALMQAEFNLTASIVLLVWTVVASLAAIRWFKWS